MRRPSGSSRAKTRWFSCLGDEERAVGLLQDLDDDLLLGWGLGLGIGISCSPRRLGLGSGLGLGIGMGSGSG
eukprot:scaffold63143_cov24-Phaeocystis_antarctica.AAC.2